MSVLELDRVVAGYGAAQILDGVSLRVGAGELVVVIGPNGAGKSTAMKAVFGLLTIFSGQIRLAGQDITAHSPDRVVRAGVAYVPQVANVFTTLTVQENLEMGAYTRAGDLRPALDRVYAMFPDLAAKRRQEAGALSGGQRQMVAMGKALMLEPRLLMLDEPTAGLSPRYRGEIFATVRRINASGVPILMVEQNAKQALGIADRAYVLVDGANRHEGPAAAMAEDAEIARMFLGAR